MKDYVPILVSLLSVTIAAIALGWNIYRDVFSKARVRVGASQAVLQSRRGAPIGPFLEIEVTNLGPGSVKLEMIVFREKRAFGNLLGRRGGVIIYDYENPFSGKLPHRLSEPGDRLSLLLSWGKDDAKCVFNHPVGRIGVRDSFGRNHWVRTETLYNLQREFAEERPASKTIATVGS